MVIILISSCNPTKYVPEGETLLERNFVKINRESVKKEEIEPYIKQKPNKRIFGARFYLGLYNLSNIKKDNFLNNWLRKIGEEPVIFDLDATAKSKEQIKAYLSSKGYFDGQVMETIEIANKKSKVYFNVDINPPYTIRNIFYDVSDSIIAKLVYFDSLNCVIVRGKPYDVDKLKAEQARVERFVRDHGFYNFTGENIFFKVDSSVGNRQVNIYYMVKNYQKQGPDNTQVPVPYKQFKVRNIYIYPDYIPKDVLAGGADFQKTLDTISYNGDYFITKLKRPTIKYDVITQNLYFKPGTTFNVSNTERSHSHLMSLKTYRLANIVYNEPKDYEGKGIGNPLLDCVIQLTPMSRQSFSVELEGTNSGGNLGGALNLIYQNKNLFRGAEQFNLKLKGAYETFSKDSAGVRKNTKEFGIESSLKLPKFFIPFLESEKFIKEYNPTTAIQAAYNYQRLPVYTRTIANASIGYQWQAGLYTTNLVSPLQLNLVRIPFIDPDYYKNVISTSNYLINSYKNVLITGVAYSYIFTNQKIKKARAYWVIHATAEAAGNLLRVASKLVGATLYTDSISSHYNLFGQPFAQYVKGDVDVRYTKIINDVSSLIYRAFVGVGVPYANSSAMPFEKQYFEGGSNGIRGWQVRSLGPGSYLPTSSAFINQTGDIKIESNLEYRFKLFSILEGATFVDAGNIWAIKDDPDRPGAQFKFNKFLNQVAIGTGFGLRFDLKFVILRADVGVKFRDPKYADASKWIFNREFKTGNDVALVIAIGYPF
ncbi:MAG: BamA/TamA family outer membrane protein [Bacteroidales bacterium]